jgi:hypothetical protein
MGVHRTGKPTSAEGWGVGFAVFAIFAGVFLGNIIYQTKRKQ